MDRSRESRRTRVRPLVSVGSLRSRALAFACLCLFCGVFTRINILLLPGNVVSAVRFPSSLSTISPGRLLAMEGLSTHGACLRGFSRHSKWCPIPPSASQISRPRHGRSSIIDHVQTYTWPRTSFRRATIVRLFCELCAAASCLMGHELFEL